MVGIRMKHDGEITHFGLSCVFFGTNGLLGGLLCCNGGSIIFKTLGINGGVDAHSLVPMVSLKCISVSVL